MSEEPKFIPPPTGAQLAREEVRSEQPQEWTPERESKVRDGLESNEIIAQLSRELADERKKSADHTQGEQAYCKAYDEAMAKLVAEREEFKKIDRSMAQRIAEACVERDNAKSQLVQAQAAIERIIKSPANHSTLLEEVVRLSKIDLSVLHEHDKEVCKPLVEALEEVRIHRIVELWPVIDAALVKVKNDE